MHMRIQIKIAKWIYIYIYIYWDGKTLYSFTFTHEKSNSKMEWFTKIFAGLSISFILCAFTAALVKKNRKININDSKLNEMKAE